MILVVDDDRGTVGLAELVLQKYGYQVEYARTAESARLVLDDPRLKGVILDYRLPGMDGLEFLRRIRACPGPCCFVPVVVLTAVADPDLGEIEGPLEGLQPAALVRKPASMEEVVDVLRRLRASSGARAEGVA
jgi:DNA-binding response OmpR family regulator